MARVERPMKPDFFPVFPMHLLMDEDYEHLTRAEWGSVFLLMQHQWIKEGTLPGDRLKLAIIARCTPEELDDLRERWPKLQEVEGQEGRVAIPWLLQEYHRAMESWQGFREKQVDAGKRSAEARAAKYGSSQPKKPNHGSNDGSNGGSNQPRTTPRTATEPPSHPIPSHQKEGSKDPSTSAPRKRDAKPKAESLEDILGGGKDTPTWEAYWKLAALFGPGKNPAPKTTAKLYAYAVVGFSYEHIHEKAQALARSVSEPKYLPQLAKWLEGEGYRNPDQSPSTSTTTGAPNGKPHHRTATDEAGIRQLQERDARRAAEPQRVVTDEEDAELLRMFQG